MDYEFDFDAAISSFTCDELKSLLSLANLSRSGNKCELQKKIQDFMPRSDDGFKNELIRIYQFKQQKSSNKLHKSSSFSITRKMARMSIKVGDCSSKPHPTTILEEARRDQSTQCSPSRINTIATQTDLSRSPVSEANNNQPVTAKSTPSSMPFYEPLGEIFSMNMSTSAENVAIKVSFQLPKSIPHNLVIEKRVQIHVQTSAVDECGRVNERLLPLSFLEIRINQMIFNPHERAVSLNISTSLMNFINTAEFMIRPSKNRAVQNVVLKIVALKSPPAPFRDITLPIILNGLRRISKEESKRMIASMSSKDTDIGVDNECSFKMSRLCPLTNSEIVMPARGIKCSHITVFGAREYLKLNNTVNAKWQCPICRVDVPYYEIQIDEYIEFILRETSEGCIEFSANGAWRTEKDQPIKHDFSSTICIEE